MNGPYEYEAPNYWYVDSINGGAFGFNTETGPGPQVPVKESILKMIPADKLWPINNTWSFHCTTAEEAFNTLDVFNTALEARYGKTKDLDDYILKAGVNEYEAMRPMFEAFRVNQHKTTGIVQWMLNSAWPSFYWQLYDYYLLPTPAYYAVRKANAPLQLIYNYGDGAVYAVNETYQDQKNLKARIQIYSIDSKKVLDKEVSFNIDQSKSDKIIAVDKFQGVEFLSLELLDNNKVVATNFYWLSSAADQYAWDKTTWAFTPMKSYADYKALNTLPKHNVKISYTTTERDEDVVVDIALTNNNDIAFFTYLNLMDERGLIIRPIFFSDNYFTMLPNEEKHITCTLAKKLFGDHGSISLSGWNVNPQKLDLK